MAMSLTEKTFFKFYKGNIKFDIVENDRKWVHITCNVPMPNHRFENTQVSAVIRREFREQIPENRTHGRVYMIFVHHYNIHGRYVSDLDNFDDKPLSDAITLRLLDGYEDTPSNVQWCRFSQKDETDYTEVWLIPYADFIDWYKTQTFNP